MRGNSEHSLFNDPHQNLAFIIVLGLRQIAQ